MLDCKRRRRPGRGSGVAPEELHVAGQQQSAERGAPRGCGSERIFEKGMTRLFGSPCLLPLRSAVRSMPGPVSFACIPISGTRHAGAHILGAMPLRSIAELWIGPSWGPFFVDWTVNGTGPARTTVWRGRSSSAR